MSTARRIAKNTSVLFISQIIGYILLFFFNIYIARYFGATGFGVISFALAFTGIFGILTDLGLSTLTVREAVRDRSLSNKYVNNILLIKIILVLITSGLIALTVNILGYPQQTIYVVYIIAFSVMLTSIASTFGVIFQVYEEMEYQAIGNILNSVLLLSGALIAIYTGLDIVIFAFIYVIASLISLIYYLILYSYRFNLPKIEVDLDFWKITFISALPLSLAAIFGIVTFKIDTVILSILKGSTAVGFYSAPFKLIESFLFVPTVFSASIFPVFSKFHVSSKEYLKLSYKKSFKYLNILGLPVAVGITILADKITLLIFGNGFFESIIALQILIWTVPLFFLTQVFATLFISIKKQNLILKLNFILMGVNIILNLVFIPQFSYIAASWITVFTDFIYFVIFLYFLSKYVCKVSIQEIMIKPIIACIFMALFLFYFPMNLFLQITIASIVYFTVLILIRGFSEDDYNIFRRVIGKKL